MTIIDLLSWDAFGSGWFWTLLLLQRFSHSLSVIGIPLDMLRISNINQLGPILKWRISRQIKLVEGLHVLVIISIFSVIGTAMVLGLWYQIEVFTALCFVILPEVAILSLGYRAAVKLGDIQIYNMDTIHYIKQLHLKSQVIGMITLLSAVFFGYGYEVLL